MKQVKVAVAHDEYATAERESQTHDIEIKIDGLGHIDDNRFMLYGVKHRPIDWATVQEGMGDISDAMKDKIAELVWKDDLVNLLVKRIS